MATRANRSVTLRAIAFTSVWAVIALAVVGALISSLYERTATGGFRDLLNAQLYNLVNSVNVSENGELTGFPDLGDLRYVQPLSGWYWEVMPVGPQTSGRLSSGSMSVYTVPSVPLFEVPFDASYRRTYEVAGPNGSTLVAVETEVVLDEAAHVARFRVMGDQAIVDDDVAQFNRSLFLYLGLVALGTVFVNGLALALALRPLSEVRRALASVRAGRTQQLTGRFPVEVEPLAKEMNALIDNNRRIVERARTQVGNLAHSLKTPIAILVNEADGIGGEAGRIVAEQSEQLRTQVQHYLDRARIAAPSNSVVFRSPVEPILERLVRVISKLNPHLDLELEPVGEPDLVFAGDARDFEEIVGNLLDNAGKWAKGAIRVRARAEGERLAVMVEDDGPGLSEAEAERALERGRRIDEAKPGSGLGLSIVSELTKEYRGDFALTRSSLGGLKATVLLPAIPGEVSWPGEVS